MRLRIGPEARGGFRDRGMRPEDVRQRLHWREARLKTPSPGSTRPTHALAGVEPGLHLCDGRIGCSMARSVASDFAYNILLRVDDEAILQLAQPACTRCTTAPHSCQQLPRLGLLYFRGGNFVALMSCEVIFKPVCGGCDKV